MPAQKIETGHNDIVHDVSMDYYGKRVATASSDSTVKIIGVGPNNSTSQHLATLTGHTGPVWQVAWAHPKFGSALASCSYDGRVIIWKEGAQNEWTQSHVFDDHKSSVNSIAWAPHELGLCLACGSSDGNISVHTARPDGGWDTTRIDQAHPVGVTAVTWAPALGPGALVGPGGSEPVQKLASGGCDNTVRVWKLYNGNWKMDCFPALQMHADWVRDVSWAPNLGLPKSTIASASQDGSVVIWTVLKEGDQWEGRVLKDFKAPVWRVSWSLTGNLLAVASGEKDVTLWKEDVDGEWHEVTTVDHCTFFGVLLLENGIGLEAAAQESKVVYVLVDQKKNDPLFSLLLTRQTWRSNFCVREFKFLRWLGEQLVRVRHLNSYSGKLELAIDFVRILFELFYFLLLFFAQKMKFSYFSFATLCL